MQKFLSLATAVIIGGFMLFAPMAPATPVFADDCYDGAILDVCDDGKGSGIIDILKKVVEIMTVGVGILGAIGLTVSGIQYLTAGGSEEQTRKAKRRIFEIVIGLAVYVTIYAILNWLIPDFHAF